MYEVDDQLSLGYYQIPSTLSICCLAITDENFTFSTWFAIHQMIIDLPEQQ